jgi:RNA polymerase sigma-70 factor (ECF subfamily)
MLNDKQLKDALLIDKNRGFELLFKRYYRPMCMVGVRYKIDIATTEDLVQDIFTILYETEEYKNILNIKSYLFTAIRNRCFNSIKRVNLIDLNSMNDLFYFDEDDSEYINDKKKELQKNIDQLPEACREVLIASVFSEMKYAEIAEEFGISINTVKTHLKKAKKSLQNNIRKVIMLF